MEAFRGHLQNEFRDRVSRNGAYSLRAFAQQLGIDHSTLSGLISGKRRITKKTVVKLSKSLGLSPGEISLYLGDAAYKGQSLPYFLLQQEAFARISDWHFDAILELSLLKNVQLNSKSISRRLGVPVVEAQSALDTLERLELLKKDKKGKYQIQHRNSTNILDPDFTSAAHRKYQRSILEKAILALESVPRSARDHTSMTMAIQIEDLPKVKDLLKKFRQDLNAFLQRDRIEPNEVFQLQISFFPLTKIETHKKDRS